MKNTIKFAATVLVIVGLLAACGGGSADDEEGVGIRTPSSEDYVVSNLTQTDDNITAVTITPKSGKSSGAVKIFYKGSSKLPTKVGEYPVTFDVEEARGWNYVSGLEAGTLIINKGLRWIKVADSTFGISSTVKGLAWNGQTFVAVGGSGKIAYSADGITWNAVSDKPFGASTINCVAWGNGKFIAGSDGGKMASSEDGTTWTAISATGFPSANDINGIVYGTDKWVAVGKYRLAYSNADGTSWTGMDSNISNFFEQGSPNLLDVAYGNGKFVLVGAAGGQGHGSSLAYSDNGINWTWWDSSAVGDNITSICYGNDTFVAVALNSILYSGNNVENWAVVSVSLPDDTEKVISLYSVAAKEGKFIAVGTYGSIFYSYDCVGWTTNKTTDTVSDNHFYSVTYGNGKWVAAGLNGVIAYLEE